MNTSHPASTCGHCQPRQRSRTVSLLAAVAALGVVGLSVYASQMKPASVRPDTEQKGDDPALARANAAVTAANKFLESLDEKQRAKALLEYDNPKKPSWSNLPVTNVPRNGVRMGDLTPAQNSAALALLAATMSKGGNQKILDIVEADQVLATAKGGKGNKNAFGTDNYFLAIFGKPSATEPWMVQFGGHHLGLNVTLVAKQFVLTPTHTGTQPESFTRDGKKVRPLGGENDKAFALVNALNDEQRTQAMLKSKVKEMLLGPGKDGKTIKAEGVKGSTLTPAQQTMLLDLIGEWTGIVNSDDAALRMAELKANVGDTYFAWSGPTTNGSAAYFRVQGPTILIEYAPQGTTDHIHTVVRDFTNDYGVKFIKR